MSFPTQIVLQSKFESKGQHAEVPVNSVGYWSYRNAKSL